MLHVELKLSPRYTSKDVQLTLVEEKTTYMDGCTNHCHHAKSRAELHHLQKHKEIVLLFHTELRGHDYE